MDVDASIVVDLLLLLFARSVLLSEHGDRRRTSFPHRVGTVPLGVQRPREIKRPIESNADIEPWFVGMAFRFFVILPQNKIAASLVRVQHLYKLCAVGSQQILPPRTGKI